MISKEQQQDLLKPVIEAEIYEAVCSIGSNKAPGPDGFSSGFFKSAWTIIKDDLTKAVMDFFKKGRILGEVNAALINLVPKINAPNFAKDFRPIACCNVVYKIISKIIANMMQMGIRGSY